MKKVADKEYVRKALTELERLEKEDMIPVAVCVCQFTLARLPASDWENRFKFVINFVRYIQNGMPPPMSVSDCRLAIRILVDLEKRLPPHEKEKIARCRFFLAYLFSKGPAGKNLINRRRAIKYWTLARQSYLQLGTLKPGLNSQMPWQACTFRSRKARKGSPKQLI